MSQALTLKPVLSINDISVSEWQSLLVELDGSGGGNPFVQYAFLQTLENSCSVSSNSGWQPCHLAFYRADKLVGVLPNYIKAHSYGEYVFDWVWAEAYERNGLEYYPKALTAVPMTPVTGPRLLTRLNDSEAPALIGAAIQWVEQNQLSSWHINFVEPQRHHIYSNSYSNSELIPRSDIQFHWHNRNYHDFDDFLRQLKAKKRKNIVRERREFQCDVPNDEDGWQFVWLNGHTAVSEDWQLFDRMYRNTFDKKGGWAQLSSDFFEECAKAMPEQTLLLLAKHQGNPIAGAFFMRSEDTLYGRYWGCFEEVEFLHFETCYYRGIEYAIDNKLKTFEPGAQGEHKLARGFVPVQTYSYHYVREPAFREAIAHSIEQESQWLDIRMQDYKAHSPYKALDSVS